MSKKIIYLIFTFSIIFISNNSFAKSPEKIVKSYLKADDVEERSEFVSDSEKTIKYMNFHYGDKIFSNKKIKVKNIDCPKKPQDNDNCSVKANWVIDKNKYDGKYYLVYKDKKWLIDWERSIGFNRKTLPTLRATGQKSVTVYASAAIDDFYYSFGLPAVDNYQSIDLWVSGDNCKGYIPRDSVEVINKALDILAFGEVEVTVKLELLTLKSMDLCFILDIHEGFQKL